MDNTVFTLLPLMILVGFSLLVLVADMMLAREQRPALGIVALIGVIVSLISCSWLWNAPQTAWSDMIVSDHFALFSYIIFLVSTGLTLLLSMRYLSEEDIQFGEYYALLLLAATGAMLMASGLDLMTIFIGLEILSISVYILAGFARRNERSLESALKYFLLGAFATGFFLYGIAMVYGATGTTNIKVISQVVSEGTIRSQSFLWIGIALLVAGFGFKVALFPFHVWTPDVYEGAPTSVTAFMSTAVKAAGFAAFGRVFLSALQPMHADWTGILWILAVFTMFFGNITAIAQRSVKRMLAYSSIAHAGYMLIAIIAGDANLSSGSLLFYLLGYAFTNVAAFGIVIYLSRKGETEFDGKDYAGLAIRHPWLAFVMAVCMVSLAGIPPTAGFMGKFYIFSAAIKAKFYWLAVLGVINSVISVYYYLRVIFVMYFEKPAADYVHGTLSLGMKIVLILSVIGIFQLGTVPGSVMALLQNSMMVFQ
ncbi:MAG: NADH-quinone oxidoreductase subunit N [Gemmatimonadetes bacterium]|nr:MAG: NADH-quinone oxidoreductase subunit N [Gemmatimonadota bacterium]